MYLQSRHKWNIKECYKIRRMTNNKHVPERYRDDSSNITELSVQPNASYVRVHVNI